MPVFSDIQKIIYVPFESREFVIEGYFTFVA
jgi:hypothetical protein